MSFCICGSGINESNCCERYLDGNQFPETAVKLMRSRFVAFAKNNARYLKQTIPSDKQSEFDEMEFLASNAGIRWESLEIHSTVKGNVEDSEGEVIFSAKYTHQGAPGVHEEHSKFIRNAENHWVYLEAID